MRGQQRGSLRVEIVEIGGETTHHPATSPRTGDDSKHRRLSGAVIEPRIAFQITWSSPTTVCLHHPRCQVRAEQIPMLAPCTWPWLSPSRM